MNFFQIPRDIPQVGPDVLFTIGSFPVTNTFLLIILIGVFLALISRVIYVRRNERVPNAFITGAEMLYEMMFNLVVQITGSEKRAARVFPIVGALLVYIGLANLAGLIPGVSEITFGGTQLFRTPTADFNTTVGLALVMIALVQVESIRSSGFVAYAEKFIQVRGIVRGFKEGIGAGVMSIVNFLIGLLDIVSEFAKVISLSLRLFGNMYAGIVLATILLGAFAFVLPSTWLALSILFGVVQALVFGALVTAYYAISVEDDSVET